MSKTAMKLALEALENAEYGDYDKTELNKAITALQEALAEQPAQQEPVADEPVFIAVCNYRRKTPDGKKDRTPHYDGVSWLHSIIGVSRTKEGAERMAKNAEDVYRDTFLAYRNGWYPMYVWEVEERATEAAHGITGEKK